MATPLLLVGVLAATVLLAEPARAAGTDSRAARAAAPQGARGAQVAGTRRKVSPYAKVLQRRGQGVIAPGSRGGHPAAHHNVKKAPRSGGALRKK